MSPPPPPRVPPPTPLPARSRELRIASEFVHWIANQGHIEELINEHVRTATGHCAECGKSWPCNWRRLADEALDLLP